MVSGRDDPGIGTTAGRRREHPGERHLLRAHAVRVRDLPERREPVAEAAGPRDPAERAPRQERQPELGAQLQLGPAGAERRRVLVLHAHQPPAEHLLRLADLRRVRVRDARHPDLPGVQQLRQRPDGLRVRHLRVRPVELVQPDRLHAEPLERRLRGLPEVLRPPVDRPAPVAGPQRGRPWWRRARTTRRRPTTPAPPRSAPRCARPRPACRWYASAVSTSVTPASSAAWIVATDRWWSGRPSIDMGIPPSPIADTWTSPILRCCMASRMPVTADGGTAD